MPARLNPRVLQPLTQSRSIYTTSSPRHLLSIADLTSTELGTLVDNATTYKRSGTSHLAKALTNKVVAMMFSKRSTRTRVSTEGAVTALGGHPMFLGKDDIQLGVNENLYDTSVVISSMVSAIVARVGPHSDIATLAKHSTVPVINALCDTYHPMQIVADFATLAQTFQQKADKLGGLKIAWVGDANNVLYDMCIGATKLGIDMAVATPKGYEIPAAIKETISQATNGVSSPGKLSETNAPEEAVKNADIVVTDTWVSMGQEDEKAARLKAFAGYQVTEELGKRGGAKSGWRFMHCLPRHAEEVSDEVFYGKRSLVFPEAENRLWAAISALEGFVVNKGEIKQNSPPPYPLQTCLLYVSLLPGPHRRSHPNLQHLSLAPLTPKYPIDPADYEAYFDPITAKLHTSASLSSFSLPSPSGILSTPSQSRSPSKTRLKRKTKSTVSIRVPSNPPSGALTSEGFGVRKLGSGLRVKTDSSWLVQTGLALTSGTQESKGQSWIAQRASSTSLQNLSQENKSGRTTPNRSRRTSRTRRKELTMTSPSDLNLKMVTTEHEYKPDWADKSEAEIAAEMDREMADELDVDSEDEFFRDRYGMLDFDGQFDSEDESDVREAVKQGFGLGQWMDGLVDVFLKLDEEHEEQNKERDLEAGGAQQSIEEAPAATTEADVEGDVEGDVLIEAPPEKPQGVWEDVRWFGRVIARTVAS